MALNDKLKTATIEDLEKLEISMIGFYARRNEKVLNLFYNQGIIDNSSIEGALEVVVFNQAEKDYEIMTAKERPYTIYADHVRRPDCLAYALEKDKFSKEEIKKIPFDHEETAETYPQRHGKENLLSLLREELLNPKPLPKSK